MSTTFYLVRHALKEKASGDVAITAKGREQAHATAKCLAKQPIARVFSTREPDYLPPAGDSAKQAGTRLSALLMELGEQHPSAGHTVLVTHGGLITDFLVAAFAPPELDLWHPDFVAVQSQLIPECSITTLQYGNGRFELKQFASVDHLRDG